MVICRGASRTVLLIGPWAIKIPTLRHGQRMFVLGIYGSIQESEAWRLTRHPNLAPVFWCAPFGLLLIMRRYHQIVTRRLTPEERDTLPFIGIDDNGANVAQDGGRLVLIDYGNTGWYVCTEAVPDA